MTLFGQHVVSMTRGEVTPLMHARIDLEDYSKGLTTCKNFRVLKYGGVTRLPGTLDLGPVENTGFPSRLLPFVFNRLQAYALEWSDGNIRIWTEDGQVESGGSPVDVVGGAGGTTPIGVDQADLWSVQMVTIGDIGYAVDDGGVMVNYTIKRISSTNWTWIPFTKINGPFLPVGYEGQLTWAGLAIATADMTSNTAPSGTVTDFKASTEAYKIFNRNHGNRFTVADNGAGWIEYDFGVGNAKTITAYALFGADRGSEAQNVPVSWVIEGSSDGTAWSLLDSQKYTSDWLQGETRLFDILNPRSYRYIRIRWLGGGTTDPALTVLDELLYLTDPDDQTGFVLDVNAAAPVNDGDGFSVQDVGRLVRVMGSDGYWRILRIEDWNSTTSVDAVVMGPAPLPAEGVDSTRIWSLGSWGGEFGDPKCVFKFAGRLGWANTVLEPRTTWLSVSADYDNYGVSQPVVDDDAITFTLENGDVDEILWATTNNTDLLLGTGGGVRIVGKRDLSVAFSPSNHEEIGATVVQACSVPPVFSGLMALFVEATKKKVYETGFSEDEGGYIARELTLLAEHVFLSGIRELHIQQSPEPTLWVVLENGKVAVCTYDQDQGVFGVGVMEIPGTDAGVESMCILPNAAYDVPMFVTRRTVDGTVQYRVERMADMYRSGVGDSEWDYPIYLMAAAEYDSTATSTITGLSHLEGETVGVYDITEAIDLGDATVASGQITVPGGGTVTNALVGLRYTSRIETLPPPNVPEDGRYLARDMTGIRCEVEVFETYGLQVGGDKHMEELTTLSDAALDPATPELVTDILEAPLDEGWTSKLRVVVETDTAYPATINALMVEFDRGG